MLNFDKVITISELAIFIKSFIPNKKVQVSGEISQVSIRGGHIYFTIKDESTNLKAILWKSKIANIEVDQSLQYTSKQDDILRVGQKVILHGKLDYYGLNSTINLIVDKITSNNSIGDLFKKYEQIKQEFTNKGYFNISHKKKLPKVLKNILLITSEAGAALQDFKINLENNNCNLNYEVANVMVQGVDCPKNICRLLDELKQNDSYYDVIVIMRGGGSFEDLFGFSQPELIETVYNFHLPILSAIGHQVDNPLVDLVADISCATPSLAAQYIIDHNKKYLIELQSIKNNLKLDLIESLSKNKQLLDNLSDKLYNNINSLRKIKNEYQNNIINDINNLVARYAKLESKLLLNEKSDINLYHNDNIINDPDSLCQLKGSIIKMRWKGKEFYMKLI